MLKRFIQLIMLCGLSLSILILSAQAATMDVKNGVLTVTGATFNGTESYTTESSTVRWSSTGHSSYTSLTSNNLHNSCGRYHTWYGPGSVYWCYVSDYTTKFDTVAHINNYSVRLSGTAYGATNSARGSYRAATVTGYGSTFCGCCNSCSSGLYKYCTSYQENAVSRTYTYTPWTSPTSTVLKNCMTTNRNASLSGSEVIIDGGTYSGSEFIPEFVHYNNLSFSVKDVI